MALTPTEEELVRGLLDKNAELLNLADNESPIISKLSGTKLSLADLPAAAALGPSDVFLVRQGSDDRKITTDELRENLSGDRTTLSADAVLYVRPDGNDSNDGLSDTAGGAFLTIQGAINHVKRNIDGAGYNVAIYVRAGTYSGFSSSGDFIGVRELHILGCSGALGTFTPADCIVSAGTASAASFSSTSTLIVIRGFTLTANNASGTIFALMATVWFGNVIFGPNASGSHLNIGQYGTIFAGWDYTISGGGVSHFHAGGDGSIVVGAPTITLTGTPAFTAYFAGTAGGGNIIIPNTTFTGAATGKRFLAHFCSYINVGAGGLEYLPGNSPGTADGGGFYVHTNSLGVYASGTTTVLAQCGIPFIKPGSGTVGNNGALTLGTALDVAYPNAFVWMVANSISAGSSAGWYYCEFSTTTAGVLYNNQPVLSAPAIPASKTAFVTTGPGAYTGDTSYVAGPTYAIRGGSMGVNGALDVYAIRTATNNANAKTLLIQFGSGSAELVVFGSGTFSAEVRGTVTNCGVLNRQVCKSIVPTTIDGVAPSYLTQNTGVTFNPYFALNTAIATDNIIMQAHSLELKPAL